MTDSELNKKVAGMMGWEPFGDGRWWAPYRNTWYGSLPDLLADNLIHKLLDLADEVLDLWHLQADKIASIDGDPARRTYLVVVYGETLDDDSDPSTSENRSHAIAYAIVAHKESKA